MAEAVAVNAASMLNEIQAECGIKVVEKTRPICLKEFKENKLKAALVVADLESFAGVFNDLAISHIQYSKGSSPTEDTLGMFAQSPGCTLSERLSVAKKKRFCVYWKSSL